VENLDFIELYNYQIEMKLQDESAKSKIAYVLIQL